MMHGKNEVSSPMRNRDTLLVHSIFPTIQGEGPDAGRVAVFVRLAKCNLRCYFCDTEFDNGSVMDQAIVAMTVIETAKACRAKLCVITGGEPLLQYVIPLVRMLNERNISVSIETAGTQYYTDLSKYFLGGLRRWKGNLIVCSPKTPKIAPGLATLIGAWKYIVRVGEVDKSDGLPVMSTQMEGDVARICRPTGDAPVYVQAMDEGDPTKNAANVNCATLQCMRFGYRLSYQVHKAVGMP